MIHTFVIPCGGAKQATAAKARDLYVGQMFANTLAAAEAYQAAEAKRGQAVRILILSAKHGLLDLDTVVEPYDLEMKSKNSISVDAIVEQLIERGLDGESNDECDHVYAMLPKAYHAKLDAALRKFFAGAHDVYEAAPGIGYQRGVNSSIVASAARPVVEFADEVEADQADEVTIVIGEVAESVEGFAIRLANVDAPTFRAATRHEVVQCVIEALRAHGLTGRLRLRPSPVLQA